MKFLAIIIIMFTITSCVNIPIPPIGQNVGEIGSIRVSLQVKYFPAELDWFNPIIPQPKLYNDK